mmetsp:Transcript_112380/g.324634  ORF Transcript_112380/g.324634 Transcript_112380/m.324634 type:complete len:139 (-) Transcript_112380:46-462(-)
MVMAPFAAVFIALLVVINIGTAGMFWYDKHQAMAGGWRVSEEALCLTALACGWPAGLMSMRLFRHKSAKRSFQHKYSAAVFCNLLFLGSLRRDMRSAVFRLARFLLRSSAARRGPRRRRGGARQQWIDLGETQYRGRP